MSKVKIPPGLPPINTGKLTLPAPVDPPTPCIADAVDVVEGDLAVPALAPPPQPRTAAERIADAKKMVLDYIFPPSMPVVPKAILRMIVYAKFGPGVRVAYNPEAQFASPAMCVPGTVSSAGSLRQQKPPGTASTTASGRPPVASSLPPTPAGTGRRKLTRILLKGRSRPLHNFEEKELLNEEEIRFLHDVYGGNFASKCERGTEQPVDSDSHAMMNRMKSQNFFTALEVTRFELEEILKKIDFSELSKINMADAFDPEMYEPNFATGDKLEGKKSALGTNPASPGSTLLGANRSRGGGTLGSMAATGGSNTALLGQTPVEEASLAERQAVHVAESKRHHFHNKVEDLISKALLAERRRRIDTLKKATPDPDEIRTDKNVTQKVSRCFYNHTSPKAYSIGSWEDPKNTLRALHRNAFCISESAQQNNPELNLNVRCLREEFKPDPNKPGWDGYCCVRKKFPSKITTLR